MWRCVVHMIGEIKILVFICFFFQAEDGIRDYKVTGVQTCALPISKVPCLEMGGSNVFLFRN